MLRDKCCPTPATGRGLSWLIRRGPRSRRCRARRADGRGARRRVCWSCARGPWGRCILETAPTTPSMPSVRSAWHGHAERVRLCDGADRGSIDLAPPLNQAVREVGALHAASACAAIISSMPRLEQHPGEIREAPASFLGKAEGCERVLLHSVHCGLRSPESFSWSKEDLGRRPRLSQVSLTPQFVTRFCERGRPQ